MEFYDRVGNPTCYVDDNENIFLWNGKPVAYFNDDKVYNFKGKLLGWFSDGWLYDLKNRPAFFSEDAHGGPVKPVRKVRPVKGVRQIKPVKSVRQVAKIRPVKSLSWSSNSGLQYFEQ